MINFCQAKAKRILSGSHFTLLGFFSSLIFSLVIFLGITPKLASAQFSACGSIINDVNAYDDLNTIPIEDCDNPFGAILEVPEMITLEKQPLTFGAHINIDGFKWGHFDFENSDDYHLFLYKKVGNDYHKVGTLYANAHGYRAPEDQRRLETKYYYYEKQLGINLSEIWRDNWEEMTPEMSSHVSDFYLYSNFSHLFESGEYVLYIRSYLLDEPQVTFLDKIKNIFFPQAFAAEYPLGSIFTIPFTVTVSDNIPPLPLQPTAPFCSLTSNQNFVPSGTGVELLWRVTNVTEVELWQDDVFKGILPASGTLPLIPAFSTTYTIKAKNMLGPAFCSVKVFVVEPELEPEPEEPAPDPTPDEPIPEPEPEEEPKPEEETEKEETEEKKEEEVDSLGTKASVLAKEVVGGKYLGDGSTFGGKGWDFKTSEFVSSALIREGYNYWNNALSTTTEGEGLDCSGLVTWAFNRANDSKLSVKKNIIKYEGADGQYRNNVKSIGTSSADLLPGDLLYYSSDGKTSTFKSHVAMYVGDGKVVEAASPLKGIISSTLKERTDNEDNFIGEFSRVNNSEVAMAVSGASPINLSVTDPEGFSITADTHFITDNEFLREISGELYYSEMVQGHDGRPADLVYSPTLKDGTYHIEVFPDETAGSNDTFSLIFEANGIEHILATDTRIADIPQGGYNVMVEKGGVTEVIENKAVLVQIDILPFDPNNRVSVLGLVPVVIFSTDTFNATTIKRDSLRLFGTRPQAVEIKHDFNKDGKKDLLVFFFAQKFVEVKKGESLAVLTGETIQDITFSGEDKIVLPTLNKWSKLLEVLLELEIRLFKVK